MLRFVHTVILLHKKHVYIIVIHTSMPLNTERTASICRCHFHVTLNTDSIQTEHIHTNISDTNTLKQKPKPKPKNFLSFTPKPTFFRTSQNPQTQASLKHKQWKGGAFGSWQKNIKEKRNRERERRTATIVVSVPLRSSVVCGGQQRSMSRPWAGLERREFRERSRDSQGNVLERKGKEDTGHTAEKRAKLVSF